MARVDYQKTFSQLLLGYLDSGVPISKESLFAHPSLGTAKDATKLKHLKKFFQEKPEFFGSVLGVLPPSNSIIDMAEKRLGEPVTEDNVVSMNRACADIVKAAFEPVVEQVVREGLFEHIESDICTIPLKELMTFLLGDFAEFSKGAGNGLVSVAGTLNELLLIRCLENIGMESTSFSQTGAESEGDIIVHSTSSNKGNLGIEIKSYHARERLLRGLRDLNRPKVGAGYFIDASEFNEGRTRLLLQTQAAAIYMPQETLDLLASDARSITSQDIISFGSRFYRPIEIFATDMLSYSKSGELPSYP
ncbi:hypothetical protein [Parasphingopyxis sp.]|uniref:hypothetical protein n=1 Tax=Parasphingopyxis sp. TaxID=1920299 RepID=UPI002623AC04|nr:hypothetical protein [Parasphingopyxis sp.]